MGPKHGTAVALIAVLVTAIGIGSALILQGSPARSSKHELGRADEELLGTVAELTAAEDLRTEPTSLEVEPRGGATPPQPAPIAASRPRASHGEPIKQNNLVIIIDDAGYSLSELEPFLALPIPLTIAVLPRLPYSAESAKRIVKAGKELILHQPMEALGGQSPGPGAIMLTMGPSEAAQIVEDNLDSLPGALGLNNHMGSAVTRDAGFMTAILELAKRRGIYYLDSLTAPGTATARVAYRENMRYWERSVFLDNSPDRASILRAFDEGKKKSENGSPAIMIGHIWSAELAATLYELYPVLAEEGFSLSTISRLMIEEADARSRR